VRPGRDAGPSPPSSAEVKNRVELYLYSPRGPLWPMKGWNLPILSAFTVYTLSKFTLFHSVNEGGGGKSRSYSFFNLDAR